MSFDWPVVVDLVALSLAISLVLWGVRIFRVYVIAIGALLGGVAGFLLGMLLYPDSNMPLVFTAGLACVGGLIAWPLQKVYIFMTAGLTAVLSGLGAVSAFGVTIDPWSLTTLGIFVAGGIVALLLFDYVIILVTSFAGGHILFSVIYSGDITAFLTHQYQSSLDSWYDRVVRSVSDQFPAYFLCIVVMVLFALYIQRFQAIRKTDTDKVRADKVLLRRISYLFAIMFVAAFLVIRLAESWIEAPMLTGYTLLAWPLVSIAAVSLIRQIRRPIYNSLSLWMRFGLLTAFGFTVIPAISYILSAVVQTELTVPMFYATFIGVSPAFTTAKVLYSTLLLPLFLMPYVTSNSKQTSAIKMQNDEPVE